MKAERRLDRIINQGPRKAKEGQKAINGMCPSYYNIDHKWDVSLILINWPTNKYVCRINLKSRGAIDKIRQLIMKTKIRAVEGHRKSLIKLARRGNVRLYAHSDKPLTGKEPSLQLELKGNKF